MKKLSKKKRDLKRPVTKKEVTESNLSEAENRFDFGGLPDRNLKKNLGC